MRIRHSDEYNPAGCTLCGKVFKNKYSLRAHVNIYHKDSTVNNFPFSAYPQGGNLECGHSTLTNNSSLLYQSNSSPVTAFSSNLMSNYIVPAASNDADSLSLMKEQLVSQYNVSNSPLT